MALSHNSFIRGYNRIYQQALRIKKINQDDFIAYCLAWHACVEEHHNYEETRIFPAVEEALGDKGLSDQELNSMVNYNSIPFVYSFSTWIVFCCRITDSFHFSFFIFFSFSGTQLLSTPA